MRDITEETSFKEGYKEALEHVLYGIKAGNKRNATLQAIKSMIRLKFWDQAWTYKQGE